MNVGVFLSHFNPNSGGGYTFQSEILRSLLELVKESRHTFTVIANSRQPEFISELKSIGCLKVVSYCPSTIIGRVRSKISRLYATSRDRWSWPNDFDAFARKAGIEFLWFVGVGACRTDLPYMTIVWDLQHRLQPWFPEVSAHGNWDRRESTHSWFLRRAAYIISGTEIGRKEIEYFYQVPAERIKILPHPVPRLTVNSAEGYMANIRPTYNIPDGYLLYPAQFWPHKNHANLLKAISILREEHKLVIPLVLVGADKGNQEYIRRLTEELGLSGQVYFLGFVSRDELVSLYRGAFALTYVTFFGPENLPPLEAFSLGCPVIASRVSGVQEQLNEAALLIDPRSPDELASAIISLHDTPELRSILIRNGFERARKWTGQDYVRGIFSILDEFESIRYCWKP